MPSNESLTNHPSMDAFVTQHGAVVKSPAGYARKLIKEYASQHWALDIDPDAICLTTLMFNPPPSTAPYPATVRHALTLTQALLNHDQRRLGWMNGYVEPYKAGGTPLRLVDALQPNLTVHACEGLYRRSTPQLYDPSTHIDVSPAEFKRFIRETDLRALYHRYLEAFITRHGPDFAVLAKAALLKAAFLQADEQTLRTADLQLVLEAVGLTGAERWSMLTPALLREQRPAAQHVVVSPLKVHRYTATDVLLIKDSRTDRTLLYIPGNSSPLQGFDNEHELADWLAGQCRAADKRLALAAHFQERDYSDGLLLSGLHTALEGVAAYPHRLNDTTGSWSPHHCLHAGEPIHGDVFTHVRNNLLARLRADARSVIRTKGEARLEGFAEGLSRSLVVTGLIALMLPEAVPFIIGLSITLVGVGVAQEQQGNTFEDRQRAAKRIEFGLFNALPLAVEGIATAAVSAEITTEIRNPAAVLDEPKSLAEQRAERVAVGAPARRFEFSPPNLRSLSSDLRQSLKSFEAPHESAQGRPTIHGPNGMLDIYHHDGHYFVTLHDKAYEVRWEDAVRRWRITSPDGKGRPGPWIKQLETDQWDIDIGGLKGGMESGAENAAGGAAPQLSLHKQVEALYPGFTPQQTAEFLAGLRANGTSIDIQLARLSMEYRSLERTLERWVNGPVTWRPVTENYALPVPRLSRRQAADIIKRCWQRQTPVTGVAARHLEGYMLDLRGLVIGDLPHLPADFSHVTAINLSRSYLSHQSISELIGRCPDLRWLNAESNYLPVVPAGIARLQHLTRLTLANNRIVLTADMAQALRRLPNLRLLNLDSNPIGSLLDVSDMPQLLNLFLRETGIDHAPAGVFDNPNLIALDLRSNRITTLPEEYFQMPSAARHTVLDGNPLSVGTLARIAELDRPRVSMDLGNNVEFWLYQTPALSRVRYREIWELFWSQVHASDFFEVIFRLHGTADFTVNRSAVTQRVWAVLEAGADDSALRERLIGMAAFPETCVDGASIIFSNMELEILISRARKMAISGQEGAQLLNLVRGLFRLEEVDGIARMDAAKRVAFTEDVEVQLAYRVGLVGRLELPINTRTMQFWTAAGVDSQALDRAEQTVLRHETPERLAAFAIKRDFWTDYLQRQYAEQFLAAQRPTAIDMEALDDLHSERPLSDAAYKREADAILSQRRQDEEQLMVQLTQAELANGARANEV
jgi:hypothetical protein